MLPKASISRLNYVKKTATRRQRDGNDIGSYRVDVGWISGGYLSESDMQKREYTNQQNKNMIHKWLKNIGFLLSVHLLCVVALGLCRVILLCANMPAEGIDWALAGRAMLIGVKFDNLIACYVSALPLLFLTILTLSTAHKTQYAIWTKKAMQGIGWFYGIVYAMGLLVEVANARYFHFFDNHLNISVTEWFGFVGDTAGMLFGDKTNWWFLLMAIVLIALFEWALAKIVKCFARSINKECIPVSRREYIRTVLLSVLMYGVCFCGIRGSFQRYPLGVSFAYFCDNAFYNRLGINPIFNIIKSAEYTRDTLPEVLNVDIESALAEVQKELGIAEADSLFPLNRYVEATEGLGKRNVVVILMESMSTAHLDEMYNGRHITPYLSDLRDKSLYFSNFYSAGVHTNNGITATLYGYGPNFAKATMTVPSDRYTGLPYALQQNGYNTYVFLTGNPQYDNMNSFFYDNSIERIFSLYDYPSDKVVNNFGVPDDYMFSYGLDCLKQRADTTDRPFFALFLTVSNHTPFVIPEAYRTQGGDEQQQIIAYADDALRTFVEQAQKTEWGRNTVFVLVGDHGNPVSTPYDYNLQYNTVPCFFVSEGLPDSVVSTPAQQQDIAPTLLGILGLPYTNNSMGINLLQQSRKYAYFVNNDHLGCSDGEWLYSYSINTHQEYLYYLNNIENNTKNNAEDQSTTFPQRLREMKQYAIQHQLINLHSVQNAWPSAR